MRMSLNAINLPCLEKDAGRSGEWVFSDSRKALLLRRGTKNVHEGQRSSKISEIGQKASSSCLNIYIHEDLLGFHSPPE